MPVLRQVWPAFLGCTLALVTSAGAATLQVSNSGQDGPSCGIAEPCRSIGRAVQNAVAGDTVLVGPGVYGNDLDADGVFNEPGEEPTTGLGSILIDKPLRIVSRLGAASTAIRNGILTFSIESSDVTLGKLNAGFTFAGKGNPIVVGSLTQVRNVRVGGNVIALDGPNKVAGVIVVNSRGGRFEHNRIAGPLGCSVGFLLSNSGDLVARNVVIGCSVGFRSEFANGVRFVRNATLGNLDITVLGSGVGFDLNTGQISEFTGNLALGNRTGVRVFDPVPIFRGNAFAGNVTNCGVENIGGLPLLAINNWWGAATGPGLDPADAACDVTAAAVTVTTPFLTSDPSQAQAPLR